MKYAKIIASIAVSVFIGEMNGQSRRHAGHRHFLDSHRNRSVNEYDRARHACMSFNSFDYQHNCMRKEWEKDHYYDRHQDVYGWKDLEL